MSRNSKKTLVSALPSTSTALFLEPPARRDSLAKKAETSFVGRAATRADPLETYLASLPSKHSRRTMRSRLAAARKILSPGSTAETFQWTGSTSPA
jgi:hypothetical protein